VVRTLPFLGLLVASSSLVGACYEGDFNLTLLPAGTGGSTSSSTGSTGSTGGSGGGSGGGDTGGSGGQEPFLEGAPSADTPAGEQAIDLFGSDGNHFWLAVDPEQVKKMNDAHFGGGGDIYTPGGGSGATYVNHLFATTPAKPPTTADYGKVQVRVVGQSTFRPWQADMIPSLSVDMDEFQPGLRLGGVEHLRFNGDLIGSIFREELAHDIYNALGYPAPRSTFAWVGSNVWGPGVEIPYTAVEVYKKDFCAQRKAQLGGDCVNMWEFVGDLGPSAIDESACQLKKCDHTRLDELISLVTSTPLGPGFKAATQDYIAWDKVHQFQCLSWMLWTGDDALHNANNVVLVERDDGRFLYLPYSVDISAGQEWYKNTPLEGTNLVATGCQSDPACWADLVATCDGLVTAFQALDTPSMVDSVHARLAENQMLRPGDEDRYQQIRAWYAQRAGDLPIELATLQEPPCQLPSVKCPEVCIPLVDCVPSCAPGEIPCGPVCSPQGQCLDCPFPFLTCFDGSCQSTCPF
jgi:hypothetical protein